MKTKIILLLTFFLILSSCIKDFHGHPDDQNGILTETNYFYSDDFKTQFLEIQIAELDVEIKELTAIVEEGQADDLTKERLELAKEEREDASNQTVAISVNRDLVFKRRPPIPGPCPKIENCFPTVQYFAVPSVNQIDSFECIVRDVDGIIIGRTDGELVDIENVDGLLKSVVFLFDKPDYEGAIQIHITEKLADNEEIFEYTLDSFIGQ